MQLTIRLSRRAAILTGLAGLAAPALARAAEPARRNASSFMIQRWQDHFDDLGVGTIVADTASRALH
jgi:hypothetical protein